MQKLHIQVLLICRWSVPSSVEAFDHDFASVEDLRAFLYDPERLRLRVWLLRHVLVPSVRAQHDERFKLLLMLGENLPEPFRSEVMEIVASVPQIRPVFVSEGQPHRDQCRELMARFRDPRATVVAEGRLDDDDAIAVDFVAMARSFFPQLRGFFKEAPKLALDFPRGFLLDLRERELGIKPAVHRLWTPALIVYTRPAAPTGLLDFKHHLLWQHMDVFSWQEQPMYLRGLHGSNDSGITSDSGRDTARTYTADELDAQMRYRFGIERPELQKAWEIFNSAGSC